ncbi:flagellar biosynthesis anti-sigma factor FlgM [Novosphingobium mangrovi (ex Huang et al. 2023)]|uniref:Flagellar biosynthesis anti-sigma factor FlgM n=1 Tax=Novosphingobium mangrovi (ex Huang et al. 2023) TaxID=2976432 RepID=A0ABT2I026_9SPHN|nr:flagellar biosynthesis anti-sigma factor FlgM [Novosphingobium mangrovi (ex Huang et al. 2023)]MCT2398147.1 flagellar biosynthesis anti-sigma factor FlgM [Novosphingobium mangrovi (ex Huang et al. 2023)]
MPPIEVGPARAITAIEARLARAAGGDALPGANGVAAHRKTSDASTLASTAVETSDALDPGAAPVDSDRVTVVRKAIEAGKYPVVPTKIADAMIAAGVLLRSPKQ